MAASHLDSWNLAQDTTFQDRVQEALYQTAISISTENATTTPFHRERARLAQQIVASTTTYVAFFTNAIATDTNVLSDATQAGTVVLTSANRAAQAALVTDAHIDSAISGEFNAFIQL